jgi:hypothetical protein
MVDSRVYCCKPKLRRLLAVYGAREGTMWRIAAARRFHGGRAGAGVKAGFVSGLGDTPLLIPSTFFHFTLPKWYSVFDDSPPLKRGGSGNL